MKISKASRIAGISMVAGAMLVVSACHMLPWKKTEFSGPAKGHNWTVPGIEIHMIYVKPGTFEMGAPKDILQKYGGKRSWYEGEHPVHTVGIREPFWIGKHEVTQKQYKRLTGENPSHFTGADRPVENVTWNDAIAFCKKLTRREREAGRLPEAYEYRLPTEAEWEYCCRAGSGTAYCFGDSDKQLAEYANYKDTPKYGNTRTASVGEFEPNAWELYNMHGNVREWCLDRYDSDYYEESPPTDPVNTTEGNSRVIRGGSWFAADVFCRSANRFSWRQGTKDSTVGFRVVLAPVTQGQ